MKKATDIVRLKDQLRAEREHSPAVKIKIENVINKEDGGEEVAPENTTSPLEFEWSAPTHEAEPPSKQWLTLWLIGSFTAVTVSVIFRNFLFALFLVVACCTILIMKYRKPQMMRVRIGSHGIELGETHYSLQDLISFWIDYNPPLFRHLVVRLKRGLSRRLYISLMDEDPVTVRRALIAYIPEREESRSLIDSLAKLLKI